jgi:hypothetical protein
VEKLVVIVQLEVFKDHTPNEYFCCQHLTSKGVKTGAGIGPAEAKPKMIFLVPSLLQYKYGTLGVFNHALGHTAKKQTR